MYFVYILRSHLDKKLYTGYSSNLKQRLSQHQDGEVVSTRNRRPLELIYYEAYYRKELALRREKFLLHFIIRRLIAALKTALCCGMTSY